MTRFRFWSAFLLATLAVVVLPGSEQGQQNPQPAPFRIDVNLVLVDVSVRDKFGKAWQVLKREDFRVFEDGVEQEISHFSSHELPLAIAFVVDRSGSIAPHIEQLRQATAVALKQLDGADTVALFLFTNSTEQTLSLTPNHTALEEKLTGIQAGGRTDILDAVRTATAYMKEAAPDYRKVILLVSDLQQSTRSSVSLEDILASAQSSNVVVCAIKTRGSGFVMANALPSWMGGPPSIPRLVRDSGGELVEVTDGSTLEFALSEMITRLKTRYTLGYYPAAGHLAPRERFRRLRIRLTEDRGREGRDYSILARTGYTMLPHPN